MSIIQFILSNWDSAILVIAAAAGVIVLYMRGEVALIENLLFTLVIKAEREFGAGTGELKRAAVIDWVYERLPKIVMLIISRKTIEGLLETALTYAKKKWAVNPLLRDYINGKRPEQDISTIDG